MGLLSHPYTIGIPIDYEIDNYETPLVSACGWRGSPWAIDCVKTPVFETALSTHQTRLSGPHSIRWRDGQMGRRWCRQLRPSWTVSPRLSLSRFVAGAHAGAARGKQELHERRLRRDHGKSRVKRCRSVKDRSRLWKVGGRDRVRDLCCALHHAEFVFPLGSR